MNSSQTPLLLAGLFACSGLLAGWSDDPAQNTAIIVDPEAGMVQPKFAVLDDGGAYVSWFGGQGFNVYLQRINADGELLWNEAGVMVADRSFSSTEDYGLDVDADGFAVLAFRDDRFGGTRITASRVSPDGDLDWGSDGVQLTEEGSFVASPRIAGASDGSIVAGWFEGGPTGLAGLDADGNVQWTEAVTGENALAISDLRASDEPGESGQVIVLMRDMGMPTLPAQLYAQKFDANGNALWGEDPVAIFEAGSLQIGNFPGFRPDGAGGMAVAWYQSQPALQVYAQRLNADGDAVFADGGVEVSTQAGQLRTDPDLSIDPDNLDLFVFWRETDTNQSQFGLYGQYLNSAGQRQWGDSAAEFIGLGEAGDVGQIRTIVLDGDPLVTVGTNDGGQIMEAARIDRDAEPVWDPEFVLMTDTGSSLFNAVLADAGTGQAFLAWQDDRSGTYDIYAQNISAGGNLGIVEPGGPAISVDLPASQIALLEGQTGSLDIIVGNTGGEDLDWSVDVDGDCPLPEWAGVEPNTGTVAPGDETDIQINLDATGLEEDSYPFSVCIDSNDPEESQVVVELELQVLDALIFEDRFEAPPET